MKTNEAPRLEVKGIQYAVGKSASAQNYSARVYIDGRPAFTAENDGHSKKDRLVPMDGVSRKEFNDILARAKEAAGEQDVGEYVRECVLNFKAKRNLQSSLSRRVIYVRPGEKGLCRASLKGRDQKSWKRVKREVPEAVILNELPIDEALALYRKNVAE